MSPGEKKSLGDYGHDDNEWGRRDDSEKAEWKEHHQEEENAEVIQVIMNASKINRYCKMNKMTKKCPICEKILDEPQATHCSDACLHKSIERSKPFDPKMITYRKKTP